MNHKTNTLEKIEKGEIDAQYFVYIFHIYYAND